VEFFFVFGKGYENKLFIEILHADAELVTCSSLDAEFDLNLAF